MPKVTRHGGATPPPVVTYPKGKASARGEQAEPAPEAGADPTSYDDLIADELRRELAERGLPTTGRKPELVARLLDDDTAPE